MAFKDFPEQAQGVTLLQRSLQRGRLGHGYLFFGQQLDELEALARTLAKTLNCQWPVKVGGAAVDCCDKCPTCIKIDGQTHADVHWVRPESRLRVILVDQMRELMREIQLKPTEAGFKVAVIVGADRLKTEAANAFLKTLEEPPPKSVMVLLSTEPARILETIMSRCLRLNFAGEGTRKWDAALLDWLAQFSALAGTEQKSLLGRYRLMDVMARRLAEMRERIEEELTARSPLEKYDDVEKELRERWEDELKAAIEAEYRRQRSDLLLLVQWWLRDVWLHTLAGGREFLNFPNVAGAERVAGRITSPKALENLQVVEQTQRLLYTNVQEALTLEVGLLKLNL
ncbi:MAG: DNA polymerase III subunit [Verrucomicrobiota bacterium]|nr:DNA polymerase III subunit [Verrucomicrobiota bacterium]MCC6820330.1 DNA polymerase III subunit [Limisphaerales bacterium]